METETAKNKRSASNKFFDVILIIFFAAAILSAMWWAITEVVKEINNLPPFGIY
jgi:hypothetical protein